MVPRETERHVVSAFHEQRRQELLPAVVVTRLEVDDRRLHPRVRDLHLHDLVEPSSLRDEQAREQLLCARDRRLRIRVLLEKRHSRVGVDDDGVFPDDSGRVARERALVTLLEFLR